MIRIGLTGGIGCGKSIASAVLKDLGAYIFDADEEAKNLIKENRTVQSELIAEFGTDVMGPDGTVMLKKLASVAFQDQEHQLRLNSVVHPYIYELIDRDYKKIATKNKHDLFVVDGAMIYESGYDQHLDYVVVITALMKNRMDRAIVRGTLSREEVLQRMEYQWTEEEKTGLADFVIQNDGTEKDLEKEISAIYKQLV